MLESLVTTCRQHVLQITIVWSLLTFFKVFFFGFFEAVNDRTAVERGTDTQRRATSGIRTGEAEETTVAVYRCLETMEFQFPGSTVFSASAMLLFTSVLPSTALNQAGDVKMLGKHRVSSHLVYGSGLLAPHPGRAPGPLLLLLQGLSQQVAAAAHPLVAEAHAWGAVHHLVSHHARRLLLPVVALLLAAHHAPAHPSHHALLLLLLLLHHVGLLLRRQVLLLPPLAHHLGGALTRRRLHVGQVLRHGGGPPRAAHGPLVALLGGGGRSRAQELGQLFVLGHGVLAPPSRTRTQPHPQASSCSSSAAPSRTQARGSRAPQRRVQRVEVPAVDQARVVGADELVREVVLQLEQRAEVCGEKRGKMTQVYHEVGDKTSRVAETRTKRASVLLSCYNPSFFSMTE